MHNVLKQALVIKIYVLDPASYRYPKFLFVRASMPLSNLDFVHDALQLRTTFFLCSLRARLKH